MLPGNFLQVIRPKLPLVGLLALILWHLGWTLPFLNEGMLGFFNDDAVYLSSAKALVEGKGYILAWTHNSLPADRFPIGFPAFLTLFFLGSPAIPEVVHRIQVGNTLLSALFLAVSWLVGMRLRFPKPVILLGLLPVVICPFLGLMTATVMSEVLFSLLLVLALWATLRYWDVPTGHRLLLATFLTSTAILVRYAGIVLPIVVCLRLLIDRRYKAAVAFGSLVGSMLAPWLVWVILHRSFGYVSQIAFQGSSGHTMQLLSLAYSLALFLLVALPGFFLPSEFLANFPFKSELAISNFALLSLGVVISGVVLTGLILFRWGRAPKTQVGEYAGPMPEWRTTRTMCWWFLLGYLSLILVWQVGFLNLGAHLTSRLMLPVVPLMAMLSLEGWRSWLERLKPVTSYFITALALVAVVGSVYGAFVQHQNLKVTIMPRLAQERGRILALYREFARQVPPEVAVAAQLEPLFYLETGRPCFGSSVNPEVMFSILVNRPIKFILLNPMMVGSRDLSIEMVEKLNRRVPGLITTIQQANGKPIGVFRVEREAFAKVNLVGPDGKPCVPATDKDPIPMGATAPRVSAAEGQVDR